MSTPTRHDSMMKLFLSYGRPLTSQVVKVYVEVCSDITEESLNRGIERIIREAHEWLPSAGVVRRICQQSAPRAEAERAPESPRIGECEDLSATLDGHLGIRSREVKELCETCGQSFRVYDGYAERLRSYQAKVLCMECAGHHLARVRAEGRRHD